jgi:mRNA-degrading endonuclease RelE of RelBE toxin-antitoxin system
MEPNQGPIYYVKISAEASRDLGALAHEALDAVHEALDALETDQRPAGARPGALPCHYVLHAGEHQILYAVDQEARRITVERIIPYCPDHSDRGEEPGS